MNHRTAWIVYSLLRLLFFAVPFAAVMLLLDAQGFAYWPTILISAAVAALVSVSLSVIFLSKARGAASESIYAWRTQDRTHDEIVEDEVLDTSSVSSSEVLDTSSAGNGEAPDAPQAEAESEAGSEAESEPGSDDAR